MRQVLSLVLLLAALNVHAEENPFLPPIKRIVPVPMGQVAQAAVAVNGMGLPAPQIAQDPVLTRKLTNLQGARMVSVINNEEVWYKPDLGVYVRYPAGSDSVMTLQAQKPKQDLEELQQALAPAKGKPANNKSGGKGKSW